MLEPAEIRQNTNSDLGEGSPDRGTLAPEKYVVHPRKLRRIIYEILVYALISKLIHF